MEKGYSINENYLKLAGSYLFSEIGRRVKLFEQENPDRSIIRLGIGDVTQPLCPAVVQAMHRAVDEMASAETFRGYAPDLGYSFLREAMAKEDYQKRGCNIQPDEIFISDGAKTDSSCIQEIFGADNVIAVTDPVYPVYVDSNVMAGRTGLYDPEREGYAGVIYMPCNEKNGFCPELPEERPDLIYLCSPNNPTGAAMTRQQLGLWVEYAREQNSVIIFDAAYEAYISDPEIPHSIYEIPGAETCAIELRSFSKNAGFTGVRVGATVIPHSLRWKKTEADGTLREVELHSLWARRHGTKFNGTAYITQRAAEAVYSEEGRQQTREQIAYYMRNAAYILEHLKELGYTVYGGVNAPYIWLKTPEGEDSWAFFDRLLHKACVVGTPGGGFGPEGRQFFRLTAFGSYENTVKAIERIRQYMD